MQTVPASHPGQPHPRAAVHYGDRHSVRPAAQAMHPNELLTADLSQEQRNRVDALLDELFDLPEAERFAALRRTREDAAVIAEVESLLRAACASGGFLTAPARPFMEDIVQDAAVGIRLGAWRVTRLLGRGGMGDVYEAARAEGDFDHRVAIKLLQREAAAPIERFQAEQQILARLEHPGIARLYDGGVAEEGRPFTVMEFVEGRPITEFCTLTHASLEQRLNLFIQVCDAVAYAHRNLVVHRDLKPSNILVTPAAQVKLLDFGIAKLLDSQRSQPTHTAAAPLTPLCTAPEQLTGGAITTATDVYALGLLLFELLADSPLPPRLIRGDLDAIVSKALRIEPAHRYATVEGLKLDVERVLRSEPVQAREGARLYVMLRTLRRYRWSAAAAAAIFVSLAGGLGVATWHAHRAAAERDVARRDALREEAVRYNLTRLFRTAIADNGAQPATAKNMIDSSAQRVLREYHDQPQLAGQIVLALADLYGALEDVTGAASLLEGFVAEAGPDADPAALADVRQKLAGIELLRGHMDRAGMLLDQADLFWTKSPRRYTNERLEGLGIRARLQRMRGDVDGSISTTREAITQRIALSGHDHRETGVLFNSLAIALTAANRLEEALAAYHETTVIYRAVGLGDGVDAQVVVANTGTLELRIGHLREAEVLLKSAFERQRSLAGDSAAVAAAMGYYGKVLSITNRNEAAIAVLREATDVAVRYAGAESPLAVQNQLYLGEVQLALGDPQQAGLTLNAAHDTALSHYGPADPLTLRTELGLAELDVAAGGNDPAQLKLEEIVAGLRKSGVQSETALAEALVALGDVELGKGDIRRADGAFREAVALREKYPDDSWELAQARERLAETLAKAGSDAAPGLLKKAAHDLEAQLGANHPQTLRAKAALAHVGA